MSIMPQAVNDWPTQPQTLSKGFKWTQCATVIGALVISTNFIALSIAALCLGGQPFPSKVGNTIQEISNIGSTVFPIVFTSLMSLSLRSIGQYYSERGISLMSLHFLTTTRGSQDAFYALKRIHKLPVVIVPCIFIWIFSPLGSQACLRIINAENKTTSAMSTARYLDTGPLRHYWVDTILDIIKTNRKPYDDLADAELLTGIWQATNTLDGPTDLWGNAKIPWTDVDLTSNNTPTWTSTTNIKGADSYTSLIGIPIHDLPQSGITTATIEASYLAFTCSQLYAVEPVNNFKNIRPHLHIACPDCPTWQQRPFDVCGISPLGIPCSRLLSFLGLADSDMADSINIESSMTNSVIIKIPAATGQSFNTPAQGSASKVYGWSTNCTVTEKHVEVQVRCESQSCRSEAIRPSQIDKRPESVTSFDYWATEVLTNKTFLSMYEPGPLKYLIHGSSQTDLVPIDFETMFTHIPLNLLSQRIGAIINTYLQIWLSLMQVRPLTTNEFQHLTGLKGTAPWGPGYIPAHGLKLQTERFSSWQSAIKQPEVFLDHLNELYWYATANATTSNFTEVYQPDAVWVAVLMVCSLTLAGFGILGIICKAKSLAPNRFDAVLAHTFDNPDFGLELGGTTLDVEDRLGLLGHLEVRVGDVRKGWDVGRIGFAMKENVAPLQLERTYE